MASNSDKNWAKGVFAKSFQGKYGELIGLGIYKNDFLDWFESLPMDDKGRVNLIMAPAQEQDKWNMFEAQPSNGGSGNRNSRGGSNRGGNSRGGSLRGGNQRGSYNNGGGNQRQQPVNQRQQTRGRNQQQDVDLPEGGDDELPF